MLACTEIFPQKAWLKIVSQTVADAIHKCRCEKNQQGHPSI